MYPGKKEITNNKKVHDKIKNGINIKRLLSPHLHSRHIQHLFVLCSVKSGLLLLKKDINDRYV
jgi:hypothetical protein